MNFFRALFLFLMIGSPDAYAHPLDMALMTIQQSGKNFEINLEVNPAVAARLKGRTPLLDATSTIAGEPCHWSHPGEGVLLSAEITLFSSTIECPRADGVLLLDLPFLKKLEATYRLTYQARMGGKEFVGGASHDQPSVTVSAENAYFGFGRFIEMGMEHVGTTPNQWSDGRAMHLPEGIDHILFVIALVIASSSFFGVLKTVTGFTIGHSLTLALASFGFVRVPSSLVESAIALSIALVAAESLFFDRKENRWRLAMLFGLVHGLGFASAITELHLERASLLKALVAFNIGVEGGQIMIVALSLPLVMLLRRYDFSRRFALPAGAAAICIAGCVWFIQRAFPV